MLIKQNEIWTADLNPQIGTEPVKTRPVLIIQTNLLNQIPHPSTIICPKLEPRIPSLKRFLSPLRLSYSQRR